LLAVAEEQRQDRKEWRRAS